ncbi:ABC transporter ATP-binding protein [Agromyces mediolanus]|uniref:ABC transporter ATP-binding protein n=1 Tax=Agromyces mediolanus TaxID=41986 RepID=A0A918CEC1_AGRME|nr:ATP-binding cassette domain-containing protein [Agromyces mediolanus]GGR19458.1 ABC transporter ATP-binding protein [Agromyces mediolanus]GLJ71303.1 ABC transporter ATP-binding protein [Agromyces mediolanus]
MLELQHLGKRFGERVALDDVSFRVAPGRLTGFVGGNGAGKTTTMRIVLGVLGADTGTVTLDGHPLGTADRRSFGYMPEERGLYPKMRVLEQTVYLARLHGWSPAAARRNAEELLERLGLAERHDDPVESLSLGNQQRAQIAAALVHRPEVLVLDEPFSGLDPIAVETVQSVLSDAADSGARVLFSSHQLDIVERICDDLVIIAAGRIRAAGSGEELRAEHGSERWELLTDGDAGWVRELPGIVVTDFDGGWARFEADSDAARRAVLAEALRRGEVAGFTREHTTLAQIFKEVVQ